MGRHRYGSGGWGVVFATRNHPLGVITAHLGRCIVSATGPGVDDGLEVEVVAEERIQAAAPGADRERNGALPGESIDRTWLPIRRPPFQGVINRTLAGSQPDWGQIGHIQPPQSAFNVLLVLIDDAGFGNPSTFGGPVDTPNFTRMAEAGLRYNRFHVTALCSPTRAALLTGRNHHTVGFGSIGELSSGFPATPPLSPRTAPPSPGFSRRTATRRRPSASGT